MSTHEDDLLRKLAAQGEMADGFAPLLTPAEVRIARRLEREGVVERRRNIGKLGGTWARLRQ